MLPLRTMASTCDLMKSVWIVDDDEDYRQLVTLALQDHCGVPAVQAFHDGDSALRQALQAGSDLPSLVLLDLHMPRISGLEVLRQLRTHRPELPVAILSNAASDDEMHRCLAEKPLALLRKPLGFHALVATLRSLLDGAAEPTTAPSA